MESIAGAHQIESLWCSDGSGRLGWHAGVRFEEQ